MAKTFYSHQGFDPVDLLAYARGHLRGAEVLFGVDFHCFDSAGYLAHLAIELLLKAATLHAKGSFAADHDLFSLLETARTAGVSLTLSGQEEGTLFLLNRFQDNRYPTPQDPVSMGNADLKPVQLLWDSLLEQLDAPLKDAFLNRDPILKGGRVLMVKDETHDRPSSSQ